MKRFFSYPLLQGLDLQQRTSGNSPCPFSGIQSAGETKQMIWLRVIKAWKYCTSRITSLYLHEHLMISISQCNCLSTDASKFMFFN